MRSGLLQQPPGVSGGFSCGCAASRLPASICTTGQCAACHCSEMGPCHVPGRHALELSCMVQLDQGCHCLWDTGWQPPGAQQGPNILLGCRPSVKGARGSSFCGSWAASWLFLGTTLESCQLGICKDRVDRAQPAKVVRQGWPGSEKECMQAGPVQWTPSLTCENTDRENAASILPGLD